MLINEQTRNRNQLLMAVRYYFKNLTDLALGWLLPLVYFKKIIFFIVVNSWWTSSLIPLTSVDDQCSVWCKRDLALFRSEDSGLLVTTNVENKLFLSSVMSESSKLIPQRSLARHMSIRRA